MWKKICSPTLIGILITSLYLLVNLLTLNNYGVTWDFTYHFNAGLWHLKFPQTDPTFVMGPSPPLSDIIPTISFLLFSKFLNLLSFDSAYNLYSVIAGSIGIGVLFFLIKKLFDWKVAFFSAVTLAFFPRYLGHLHNNMKDIPQAVFFTLSILTFWQLVKKPSQKTLIFAALSFALAFNSKVNAIFVLIIAAIYLFVINIYKLHLKKRFHIDWFCVFYFFLAPILAFGLWSLFWDDPVARIIEAKNSYTTSTINMPLLYFGRTVFSGQNIPFDYPLGMIAVTTPFLALVFFPLGFIKLTKMAIKEKHEGAFLLLLWFLIPLSRYFRPNMIIIDDIRHFMEVIFPYSAMVGVGFMSVIDILKNRKNISYIFVITFIIYLIYQNVAYFPYQTSYFSEWIGGLKGAQGKFDVEFWADSYKESSGYLNTYAIKNSKINFAMAPDIGRLYLREDLQKNTNKENMTYAKSEDYSNSDYTVIMNRESFFNWYNTREYMEKNEPVFILEKLGVPLVFIYKNKQ